MSQSVGSGATRWQRRKRRLAKKKRELAAKTADTDVDVVGLAAMPREILDKITQSIECIQDMGAWSIATGLPTQGHHLHFIETENISTEAVLAAGAPLVIVDALLSSRQDKISLALVAASALGGHLDVYRHVARKNSRSAFAGSSDAVGSVLPTLIRRGLVAVANEIVTDCSPRMAIPRLLLPYHYRVEALKEALRGSHTALAGKLHGHADHHEWDSCLCYESVLPWIFESDLPVALATLRRIGCRRVKVKNHSLFARAIETGAVEVASQLAGKCPTQSEPLVPAAGSVLTAASKGHVDVIAWLYRERRYNVPVEVLGAAARQGHLHIIQWAARAQYGRPIASWNARYIAYAAVEGYHPETIIGWLLTRPIDRRDISVGVAKAALARHGVVVPLLLHKSGIAPFGTWDALEMVVERGSTYSAYIVVSNGGRCSLAALARCLTRSDPDMIALLAERYTHGEIQTVLDSGLVGMCSWAPIAWLVDNVTGLCVRDARDIFMASLSMGPYPCACACATCHRSVSVRK
ncbi:hypothetical protein pmac_cds_434 [Pandoravirus macleodensis]|uniref:Ankyrin repeat domain containing protein n=1 Tax=Pandoravirus macleodensis TaxID=2107707 RepID=A0A2U7UFD8_9VIRU|nr:hypothetical protein pmac_cds_434 [Pandoravirus macleodensis]AVK77122.1 hypothetical protein pmac_cds_434 [Pandoravirus macleodensis]